MSDAVLWTTIDRERFFLVPPESPIPSGPVVIERIDGSARRAANLNVIGQFEVSRATATSWLSRDPKAEPPGLELLAELSGVPASEMLVHPEKVKEATGRLFARFEEFVEGAKSAQSEEAKADRREAVKRVLDTFRRHRIQVPEGAERAAGDVDRALESGAVSAGFERAAERMGDLADKVRRAAERLQKAAERTAPEQKLGEDE